MAEIEESWTRVTAWLAANAPASYATLNPPATAAELDACERDLGLALPAELRRLLLINNGAAEFDADEVYHPQAAFLPGDHRLLAAAEVAELSQMLVEILADLDDDIMVGSWWHPQWVLFGSHVAADGMVIDQHPGPDQGAVGEYMHEGGTEFTLGVSLGDYLAQLVDSIEHGTDFHIYRPCLVDGGLEWDVITGQDET